VEQGDLTFGVCTFLNQLTGFGTELKLDQVYKRHEDGRLDVKTIGLRTFKILSFDNPMPGKLYAGGEIEYLPDNPVCTKAQQLEYVFYLKEILHLLQYQAEFDPMTVSSYTFAHKVGLKLEEELELLKLTAESERIEFLVKHFKRLIPVIKAIESAKEKIKLNGHFKHLDPLNF
jgi:Lon protease-like protein